MAEAFVTLATTDEYCCGALVLAHSLRKVGTTKQLVCMVTSHISQLMRPALLAVFDHVEEVNVFDSKDEVNLALLARPDLGVTFTKIHCWRLTQYSKAVFLDADTLVMQNIDDLFERDELSAVPDPGWPDCFNSGVFVYRPSVEVYKKLLALATESGSFDGGDQGLLNMFFSDWSTKDIRTHLSFVYNCMSQAFYSYPPAFKHFKSRVRVVHFIGAFKPWHQELDTAAGTIIPRDDISWQSLEYLHYWWRIFLADVKPLIKAEVGGLVAKIAALEVASGPVVYGFESEPLNRQMAWERGQIDYTGEDRFSRIQSLLDESMSSK